MVTVYNEILSGCQPCPYGVGACFRDCPHLYHWSWCDECFVHTLYTQSSYLTAQKVGWSHMVTNVLSQLRAVGHSYKAPEFNLPSCVQPDLYN
jgi:hypothetical protein